MHWKLKRDERTARELGLNSKTDISECDIIDLKFDLNKENKKLKELENKDYDLIVQERKFKDSEKGSEDLSLMGRFFEVCSNNKAKREFIINIATHEAESVDETFVDMLFNSDNRDDAEFFWHTYQKSDGPSMLNPKIQKYFESQLK